MKLERENIHSIVVTYEPVENPGPNGIETLTITIWEKPGSFGRTVRVTPEAMAQNAVIPCDLIGFVLLIFS